MSSPTSAPSEALAGLMERVTFHNADTGFCVLRVKARGQRDLITVVGHAASIAAGEWVQMSGNWLNDRTYDLQFKAAFLKASPPTTLEGIERYLGSGMIEAAMPILSQLLKAEMAECEMRSIASRTKTAPFQPTRAGSPPTFLAPSIWPQPSATDYEPGPSRNRSQKPPSGVSVVTIQ